METLVKLFTDNINPALLVRCTISNRRRKSVPYTKVTLRPLSLKGEVLFQAEYTYPKKVTQENMGEKDAVKLVLRLVEDEFKQVDMFTVAEDIQILASKPAKPHITTKPATRGLPTLTHNKKKNYCIAEDVPCDFLIRLGVMTPEGKVVPRHYSKFRQLNRYLEIVEDVFPSLPKNRTLKIIDFGCGKAYLTFALYYYLHQVKGRDVEIVGLDLKDDVINFCSKVAKDLHYDGLTFLHGDIADYKNDAADMVVTLHACDTATDYALINAVSWGTKVILSVPCCQHELFTQIQNDVHQPMLKHGILKDRLTEYLTDGLRGLKLESCGYHVSMIEFTSLEHTARNIMIKAVKMDSRGKSKEEKAQKEYDDLCAFYHVHPTIDKLKIKR